MSLTARVRWKVRRHLRPRGRSRTRFSGSPPISTSFIEASDRYHRTCPLLLPFTNPFEFLRPDSLAHCLASRSLSASIAACTTRISLLSAYSNSPSFPTSLSSSSIYHAAQNRNLIDTERNTHPSSSRHSVLEDLSGFSRTYQKLHPSFHPSKFLDAIIFW